MFTPYLSSLYVKSSKKTKSATTSTKIAPFWDLGELCVVQLVVAGLELANEFC